MSQFYSQRLNSFGTASIPKLVLQFSVPAIISMLVNALYNIVDRFFVGQGVGSLGIAGITLCFPICLFIMAMSMMIGVGGNGVKGAGVGVSTVNSTSGSGVGGSSGVGSGGSTGGGSGSSIVGTSTGSTHVGCDEIAVTTQSTMTNKVGTTIAVRGAESRWSSIRASLYSRVSRGIPRPLDISKSRRKNPFSVYLSSFMSHLSLLAVLSRRKVKVHLPQFFRKIFQRQRQAFGVGRNLETDPTKH